MCCLPPPTLTQYLATFQLGLDSSGLSVLHVPVISFTPWHNCSASRCPHISPACDLFSCEH